jgi:hypothetical protein
MFLQMVMMLRLQELKDVLGRLHVVRNGRKPELQQRLLTIISEAGSL